MKLNSGYYFFQGGAGYVLVKINRNFVKIHCLAENIPANYSNFLNLCLWDTLNIEPPLVLGKIPLRPYESGKRGECIVKFDSPGGLTPVLKYDAFALMAEEKVLYHTPVIHGEKPAPDKEEITFDPFKTTNPAYTWSRAETLEKLKKELLRENILPFPEISEGIKNAFPKYKHILLGRYRPAKGDKKYYIIGIPGDRPPSCEKNVFRWINKCVSLGEYPYFDGYRLYYFDSSNGALVKAVLRT